MERNLQARTSRFVAVWSRYGLIAAVARSLRVLCKPCLEVGSLRFFHSVPAAQLPAVVLDDKFEIREATPADAHLLVMDRPVDILSPGIAERFSRGDRCIMVRDEQGRCVHARWLSVQPTGVPEIGRCIMPRPGQLYMYDAYTREDSRGLGIDSAVRLHVFHQLEGRASGAITYVHGGNPPGLNAARKWQDDIGGIFYLAILQRWRFAFGGRALRGRVRFVTPERLPRKNSAGAESGALQHAGGGRR